jgi:uncharacterized protein (TIGR04255 family)
MIVLVEKCNQNNAIKVAAFAIEFSDVCSANTFKLFSEYVSAEKSDLFTSSKLLEYFNIQINTEEPEESVSKNQEVHGVVLNNDNGWALSFKDNILVLQCTDYISWDESIGFAKEAWAYFISFLENYLKPLKIKALGLEYLDEFLIKDENANWVEELFSKDSKYLPEYIFSQSGFWHVHTGFYEKDILTRLQMNHVQDAENRSLQVISMQHRFTLAETSELFLGGEGVLDGMYGVMEKMHSENVSLIKDILSSEVLEDINMEVK